MNIHGRAGLQASVKRALYSEVRALARERKLLAIFAKSADFPGTHPSLADVLGWSWLRAAAAL
jgi:hypothetical protein